MVREEDGPDSPALHIVEHGVSFGEFSLLTGLANTVSLRTRVPSQLIRLGAEDFWTMMSLCPAVRSSVLGNMAERLQKMQSSTIQQEKMATLGTMAAGLMHELNNPGTAAKRATAQLRETLLSMQRISTGLRRMALSPAQQTCLEELQAEALEAAPAVLTSSLDQADAEEALAAWVEQRGVPNGWEIAPTLVAAGMTAEHLECAAQSFPDGALSEVLAWLGALSSSLRLVTTVEESIGRVSDLVHAVKHYAYEGRGQKRTVDVNESIRATLLMLGHKIREKNVSVSKHLDASLPAIESSVSGLNQIWTNLLDNALDASHPGGHIEVETSRDGEEQDCVVIRVSDDGGGIPQECQAHIFDPFFTTKEAGTGTGLGPRYRASHRRALRRHDPVRLERGDDRVPGPAARNENIGQFSRSLVRAALSLSPGVASELDSSVISTGSVAEWRDPVFRLFLTQTKACCPKEGLIKSSDGLAARQKTQIPFGNDKQKGGPVLRRD